MLSNYNLQNKRKTLLGFSIVELVIVIAVIAILAAVLIPTFSQIITKAKQAKLFSEANSIYKNYLVNESQDENVLEYVIIKMEEDICIMYFKGEQIQEILTFSEVKERVEKDNEFVLIQLENYDKVYISEKVVEENNEPREVEFMIIDGVLMWRYRGDTEWKPIMPLDDLGCTLGSSEEQQ